MYVYPEEDDPFKDDFSNVVPLSKEPGKVIEFPELTTEDVLETNVFYCEQAVLTVLFNHPHMYCEVTASLLPEDFYDWKHRTIYKAMLVAETGDFAAVVQELKDNNALELVMYTYLMDLFDAFVVSVAVAYHIRRIRNASLTRRLARLGSEVKENAESGLTAAQILKITAVNLGVIAQDVLEERSSPDLSVVLQRYREQLENPPETRGITTGVSRIDHWLGGMLPGHLMVIAARPGVGKTCLALDICRHVGITLNKRVLFLSLEMSQDEIAARLVSAQCGIPDKDLQKGLSLALPREYQAIEKAMEELGQSSIKVLQRSSLTVADLRLLVQAHNADMVIVDYLQQMVSASDEETRNTEIGAISRGLKMQAIDLGLPVIALSQLTRETVKTKVPMLNHLRDSGSIEADADSVILIHRPDASPPYDERPGEADFILAKNRHGATGTATVRFNGGCFRFESP